MFDFEVHWNAFDIMKWFSLPKESREREIIRFIYLGNHIHNINVIKRRTGKLVVVYRPTESDRDYKDYLPCPNCLDYYSKTDIHRHRCRLSDDKKVSLAKSRYLLAASFTNSEELKQIMSKMRIDDIGLAAMNDDMIKIFSYSIST